MLRHTRLVWNVCHISNVWMVVECSGRFWMVVQGKEKQEKVNKVQHLPDRGHDITPLLD